ncbi:hypothetical protein KBY58_00315 [Cyanobium sp. HWJ4-Hawea]|uniref:hypothetical protein n=1 Tax=Cyanobium sp. HWJ4-Hawea TaxID=2823713 RepID=UPI0020CBE3A2|nr:hypothetical protein [Cyanobium sp. HWJ4-Hawea]MCP9807879.1 hypothetical protein [Cyanobium sp. HWJ4-Hawea]
MTSINPLKFIIPAKTEFASCTIYTKGNPSECPQPRLSKAYQGEIVYDSITQEATFFGPTQKACDDFQIDNCLLVKLSYYNLLKLAKNDSNLKGYLIDNGFQDTQNESPTNSTGINGANAENHSNNFGDILAGFVPVFGIVILSVIVAFAVKKLLGLSQSQKRVNRATGKRSRELAKQSASLEPLNFTLNPDALTLDKISYIITPLSAKIDQLSSKVEQLETDIFSLTQQLQTNSVKSLRIQGIASGGTPYPLETARQSSELLPLTVDLIKKAVATGEYFLISAHPHYFVSETPQSQQGLEDVKRFTIDGDSAQASSRTQSEFIAIPCDGHTYLIPNIVPNSTDPARTLKRHADRNNIYRNGQGANFLSLDELAVVEKNGDRYDLIRLGQIQ